MVRRLAQLAWLLVAASVVVRAQGISLTVNNLPAAAQNVVVVVDQGGLASSITSAKATAGADTVVMTLGLPVGGPYRVRAIASPGIFPAGVLRTGQATGVHVSTGTLRAVSIRVSDLSAWPNAASPASAPAGSQVQMKIDISDPGDSLDGVGGCYIRLSATPFLANGNTGENFGTLSKLASGSYQCVDTVTLPASGSRAYYQVLLERSYSGAGLYSIFLPNLDVQAPLWQMELTTGGTLSLNLTNIPSAARSLVTMVDQGGLVTPLIGTQPLTGADMATVTTGVPSGGPFRLRVFATPGEYPAGILRSGAATGLSITSGATVPVAIRLNDLTALVDASTPSSAVAGATVTVKVNISDPGDSLEGQAGCSIRTSSAPFIGNANTAASFGTLTKSGAGSYVCTASLAAPSSGSRMYYQLMISRALSGGGSYSVFLPNLDTQQPLWQMSLMTGGTLSVTVSNIPAAVGSVIAIVDQGGLTNALTFSQPAAGATSLIFPFSVPSGGPYRVRALFAPSVFPAGVLRTGTAGGLTVGSGGVNSTAVYLSDVSGAVNAATPSSVWAGSAVTVQADISDPGDLLDGVAACYVRTAQQPLTYNSNSGAAIGYLIRVAAGSYRCAASVNLPASGNGVYCQVFADRYIAGIGDYSIFTPNFDLATASQWRIDMLGGGCTFSATAPTEFASAGGSGTASVTTANGCSWAVGSNAGWISVPAGQFYYSGNATFTVSANPSYLPRNANLTVAGTTFTIIQAGAPISYGISPQTASVGSAGGTGTFTASVTPADAPWSAVSSASWLVVTGSGTYTVAANNSVNARAATITVGNAVLTVTQTGANATFGISPLSASVGSGGGSGTFTVTPTPADAPWTAVSSAPWLAVSGASYSATANNSVSARSATITVGAAVLTVTQAGGTPSFAISPGNATVASGGGSGTFTVTPSPPDAPWSAASSASWLVVTGNSYSASANNSISARSATITVGNAALTVTQSGAGVTYGISPPAASFSSAGGSGTFTATVTPPDAPWSPISSASWLTLTSNSGYTVAANNSVSARTATITVGSAVLTVTQSGAIPSFSISPTAATVPGAGGSAMFTVTPTPPDAPWSASSNRAWLTLNGSAYSVVANNSVSSRTASITVGAAVLTVTQSGASASFTVSPTNATLPAAGGSGTFTVTPTPPDASATPVSSAPWLTVSGSSYSAGANNSVSARNATITIGNAVLTITQAGAGVTYNISPQTATFADTGGAGTFTATVSPADAPWTPVSSAPWLSFTGNGTYNVAINNSVSQRTGTISVGDAVLTVNQSGATPSFAISPTAANVSANGGTGTFAVTPNPPDASAIPTSDATWLIVTGTTYTAAANNSVNARTARISVGNAVLTITQSGATSTFSISPTAATLPASGGTGSFTVTPTPPDAVATPSTTATWLAIAGSTYTAGANPAFSSRSATITAGDAVLTITQLAADPNLAVTPQQLSFHYQLGDPDPSSQSMTVTVNGPITCSVTSGAAWLSATGIPGSTTKYAVAVFPSGLTPGTYATAITVTPSGSAVPLTVAVTLTVTPAPSMSLSVATMNMTAAIGASGVSQTSELTISGSGSKAYSATPLNASWLSVSPASGSAPATLTVTANPAGLLPGLYSASVAVAAAAASNSPTSILVNFTVTAPTALSATPSKLNLTSRPGVSPANQTLAISCNSGGTFSASVSGGSWLSISSPGGTLPSSLTVSFSSAGLVAGTYTATINLASSVPGVPPLAVPVTLAVTPAADNAPPIIDSIDPSYGTGDQTFRAVYKDSNGWTDIVHARLNINIMFVPQSACYVDYNPATDTFQLMNDTGNAWLGPVAAGSYASLTNGACTLIAANSGGVGATDKLTVTVRLKFASGYGGKRNMYLYATDAAGASSETLVMGCWYPVPAPATLWRRYRLYVPTSRSHHYTTDANEYAVLGTWGYSQEGVDSSVYDGPITIDGQSAVPFWRIYAARSDSHLWTTDQNEYSWLIRTFPGIYIGEGADAFLFLRPVTNAIPLYRLAFKGDGPPIHHWTTGEFENNYLISTGAWQSEGIAGYLFNPAAAAPAAAKVAAAAASDEAPEVIAVCNPASRRTGFVVGGEPLLIVARGLRKSGTRIRVYFDSLEASVSGWDDAGIRVTVPVDVSGRDTVRIEVEAGGHRIGTLDSRVAPADPGVFTEGVLGVGSTAVSAARGGAAILRVSGVTCELPAVRVGGILTRLIEKGTEKLTFEVPWSVEPGPAVPIVVQCGEWMSQAGATMQVE